MSAAPKLELVTLPAAELRELVRVTVREAVREALADGAAAGPSEWIGADEAAQLVGVSRGYLRRLQGLPVHGSRRAPRYRRDEVEAFVRTRR